MLRKTVRDHLVKKRFGPWAFRVDVRHYVEFGGLREAINMQIGGMDNIVSVMSQRVVYAIEDPRISSD